MEGRKVGVPASAIQQIKINQDAYSAEFARPGHGRVEVITKAGSEQYHGEAYVTVRDARLNARNAFADTRPPEQRRIFEGVVSGPIGSGRASSFMLAVNREETDQQAIVFAEDLSGRIRGTLPTPQRDLEFSATVNRQQGKSHTMSLRAIYQADSAENEGVGGTTLAEAGLDSRGREFELIYSHRTMITGRLVNQFRLLVGGNRQTTTSRADRPSILGAGRVHWRGRPGRSVRRGAPVDDERNAGLVARAPRGEGRRRDPGLEPAPLRRPEQLRRHVLVREPLRLRGRPAVPVHQAAG